MTEQRLFDWEAHHRLTIQERFDAWIVTPDGQEVEANIMTRIERLWARGWRHFGIGALWEAARYDRALVVGPDDDGFKLNDHFRSRLARRIMEQHPWLEGFFELRELRS